MLIWFFFFVFNNFIIMNKDIVIGWHLNTLYVLSMFRQKAFMSFVSLQQTCFHHQFELPLSWIDSVLCFCCLSRHNCFKHAPICIYSTTDWSLIVNIILSMICFKFDSFAKKYLNSTEKEQWYKKNMILNVCRVCGYWYFENEIFKKCRSVR